MFNFITRRPLWVNILVGAALALALVFAVLKALGWITKHGEYLTVPSLVGKKTSEAIKILEKQGFDVQIQDSIFVDSAARGVVLKQLPDPNATVKINRTVFITVNRVIPPLVDMPKLEGQSLSFALELLQRSHLVLGDTIFKPDFAIGTVLEQRVDSTRIPEKSKVQWGTKINLVVSSGLGDQELLVPDVVGMKFSDAKLVLESSGLIVSVIPDADVRDSANAFVTKQRPVRFDELKTPQYIKPGQVMDLNISVKMPIDSLPDPTTTAPTIKKKVKK